MIFSYLENVNPQLRSSLVHLSITLTNLSSDWNKQTVNSKSAMKLRHQAQFANVTR